MDAEIIESRDEDRDLTTVMVVGQVNVEQVIQQIVTFLTDRPTQRVLWDIRGGSLTNLTPEYMRQILAAGMPHAHRRRGGRSAILCAHAIDYGLARIFQTLASFYNIPFEIQVMLDEDEAMAWLFAIDDRLFTDAT